MDKKQEEETTQFFVKAFHEVVIPALESMEERLTKKLASKEELKREVEKLASKEEINNRFDKIEVQLTKIEDKLDRHNAKLDNHEKRISKLEVRSGLLT